jgi:hypothetical protein
MFGARVPNLIRRPSARRYVFLVFAHLTVCSVRMSAKYLQIWAAGV